MAQALKSDLPEDGELFFGTERTIRNEGTHNHFVASSLEKCNCKIGFIIIFSFLG